jgi:hypothetical protein
MIHATDSAALGACLPRQNGLPSDPTAYTDAGTRWVNLGHMGGLPRWTRPIGKQVACTVGLDFWPPLMAWTVPAQALRVAAR